MAKFCRKLSMSEIQYAGFWRRVVATILDQIILAVARAIIYGVIVLIVYAALHVADIKEFNTPTIIVLGCSLFFIDIWLVWIYFALMESSSLMATLGKLAMGMRVLSSERNQLTFERATVRYFAKILSRATLLVGYILSAFSSKKQALHDFVAKTIVVVSR